MTENAFFQPPVFKNIHWVYFNSETGEIVSITNETLDRDDLSCIEVSYDDVAGLVSGEEQFIDRKVEFDPKIRAFVLKQNTIEQDVYTVDDAIHHVTHNQDPDITVIQDIENTCWKFLISPELRSQIIDNRINLNTLLAFSITEENNPNILYRTLTFPFKDLIKQSYVIKDFLHDYEFAGEPISVYTIKRFDSYSFEVNQ